MDSVSQFLLGASVSIAVMNRKVPVWQSALVGAIMGTLPDLDVFIDHGDAIRNMTLHRTESHSLLPITLISPLFAWLITWGLKQKAYFKHWWLACWLALFTHPLLDLMTVYGTQLGLPFTDYPFAISSIYIVDPLYTLPLLFGCCITLFSRKGKTIKWNNVGLTISCLYLAWSVLAQNIATQHVEKQLARQNIARNQVLISPTALNTVVWRVLIMTPERYGEGYYSLLSPQRSLSIKWQDRGASVYHELADNWFAQRVAWFSHGFYSMKEINGHLLITDLRMGEEPDYTFTFDLGTRKEQENHPARLPGKRPVINDILLRLRARL